MLTLVLAVVGTVVATAIIAFMLFWKLFFIPVAELLVALADAYPHEFDKDPASKKMVADIRAMLKRQGNS